MTATPTTPALLVTVTAMSSGGILTGGLAFRLKGNGHDND